MVNLNDQQVRQLGVREWVMIITLMINIGGMVWGAASLTTHVSQLNGTVQQLNSTLTFTVQQLNDVRVEYNARLAVVESEIQQHERQNRSRP